MTSLLWQSDDAARLKWLRENANITANEFAKTHAISLAQLAQLENEGDSTFYSPIIKYQLGKKLLKMLGEKTALETHSASVNGPFNQKDQALASLEKIAEASNRDYNPPAYKAFEEAILFCWKEHIVFSRLILLAMCLLIGNHFLKEQLIAFGEKYLLNDVAVVVEVISNNADKKIPKAAEPTVRALSSDAKTQLASPPLAMSSKDCRWTETPVTLMSHSSKKPTEYVYLMAINDLSTCVIGQDKPMSTHILKAGEGQTVNGRAPFRIYSERLSDLKIFFQGRRVILPNQEVSDVLLIESAVE